MPASNSAPGSSGRTSRGRRTEAARRISETRRAIRESRSSPLEPALDLSSPLPIIHQGELGSAATLSTLARHRMSRRRDHDPVGMTVQQAVDQLGEHNDTLNAALREPLPAIPDNNRDEDNAEHRRKRRKRDHDPLSNRDIPQYGYNGRVVPGELQMQILTCDGGEHRLSERGELQVANILLDNDTTYCSESPKCNIILKHRGETPFSLTKLVIKNPKHADQFSSRLQEGLVFVSMSADDLHFRTERYDLVKDHSTSSPTSTTESSPRSRRVHSRPTRAELLQELEDYSNPRQHEDTLEDEWYDRYQAVYSHEGLPAPFPAARVARNNTTNNAEARLRELVSRNEAMLRHNSWQQIEPDGGPSRISTTTQIANTSHTFSSSLNEPFTPPFQDFEVTMIDDPPDIREGETTHGGTAQANRRWFNRAGTNSQGSYYPHAYISPFTGVSSEIPESIQHLVPLLDTDEEREDDDDDQGLHAPNTLPSMRMEPNDEHPMLNGRQLRRAHRRNYGGGRLTQPRKVEWVPNKVKRADMGKGAANEDVLRPHAHFFIKKGGHSVALEFSPPVSGRYILLKLWAPPGKDDIDVQSIIAHGYASTRMFASSEMR